LVLDIMELRAYANAKAAVERGGDLPAIPMVKKVAEIQQELDQMAAEGKLVGETDVTP